MEIPSFWRKAIIKDPMLARWYFHWRESLNHKRTPLEDELPWLTYSAISWLSHYLNKSMILFEWGSGGSTVFFSRRVRQIISIEHDPTWYQEVADSIEKRRYKNIALRLVPSIEAENINPWYTSAVKKYTGRSFEAYIEAIDMYPDSFFDVVVVDGRARPGCIRQSLAKIRRGGYLVLDDSERGKYKHGLDLVPRRKDLRFFGPTPYIDYPRETRIMQIQNMS